MALVIGLFALAACDDDPGPDPRAFVEIGTGDDYLVWEPLTPGQQVDLHAGTQGGYHVWGGFKGDYFEPEGIEYDFVLWDGATRVGGVDYVLDRAIRGRSGSYELGGVPVFIQEDLDVASLDGKRLRMTLELRSEDGAVLTDEVMVVARCCVELPE